MRRLMMAAALALAPAAAFADHNHGVHGQHAHGAAQAMLAASTPSDGAVLAEAPRVLALISRILSRCRMWPSPVPRVA